MRGPIVCMFARNLHLTQLGLYTTFNSRYFPAHYGKRCVLSCWPSVCPSVIPFVRLPVRANRVTMMTGSATAAVKLTFLGKFSAVYR